MAEEAGCKVVNSVTKKVTILVVGTQDKTQLKGYDKSTKHRKVEELIAKGSEIMILSEKDFLDLCNHTGGLRILIQQPCI